ncbi:MAG TPA: methyltransferase domain-containing protein [Burkholderiales bacterium]|nr:methyltransferase domain-containing protein [Burkholderiales bacterium]
MHDVTRVSHVALAVLLFALVLAARAQGAERELERTGGPYVPTPQIVVDHMLRFANVGPDDFVVDLGSGDGVIVLTAAREFKARGFGVDIDPELVKLSNSTAQRLGIADRAAFYVQDVFKTDLSRATVVTLYLLPGMMINLRPKIYLELRPGTRVVAHDYHFDEWRPDDQITFDVAEKEKVNGVPRATLYLWIVPAKIGGRWNVRVEGAEQYDITLRQTYQVIEGAARTGNRRVPLLQPSVRGEEVSFTVVATGGARQFFQGRANGDSMSGTVELGKGRTARWTAVRAAGQAAAD